MLEEDLASIVSIDDLIREHPNWDDEKISGGLAGSKEALSGTGEK